MISSLIQQPQSFKDGWPNMWNLMVGGSGTRGGTSSEADEREVHEEFGYKIDLSDKRPVFTVNFEVGFDDYYVLVKLPQIKELTLQYEEVKRVKWASEKEIMRRMDEGEFTPYYRSFIQMLFDMRGNKQGAHQS